MFRSIENQSVKFDNVLSNLYTQNGHRFYSNLEVQYDVFSISFIFWNDRSVAFQKKQNEWIIELADHLKENKKLIHTLPYSTLFYCIQREKFDRALHGDCGICLQQKSVAHSSIYSKGRLIAEIDFTEFSFWISFCVSVTAYYE